MATNDIVNIKWDHFGVFRRFQLPSNITVDLYQLLLTKINAVVPDFTGHLGWRDAEGDIICFSTDEELRNAIQFASNSQLRIQTIAENLPQYENEKTPRKAEKGNKRTKESHPFVTCNRCDQPLYGIRYKCAICDDFDLCEECEKDGTHPDHALIRYATPRTPKIDPIRPRRTWRQHNHGFGHRDSFLQEGIFGRTAAAAAQAAQHAANAAAQHAARHAARHAAAAATHFADNVNAARENGDGFPPQFRDSVAQGMEYLKEVGTQIQQAFANFGIEVDMDVQNDDNSAKIPKTEDPKTKEMTENKKETNDEKENGQKKDNTKFSKNCSDEPENEDGKRKNDDSATQNVGTNSEELDVPMKKMHISEHNEAEVMEQNLKESTPDAVVSCDDISDEWTMMDISSSGNKGAPLSPIISDGKCMAGTPFIVPPPGPHNPHCYFLYPEEHIALCVIQLEGMGFDNCNGWLTKLAVDLKGDVSAVIENMKNDPLYAKRFENDI